MTRGVAAGLGLGLTAGWNLANTGAIAGVLEDAYRIELSAVGLLTTALVVTHFAVQVPGGRLVDRFGARRLGLAAVALAAAANAVALLDASFELALAARALMGFGTGAAFVAGSDIVRSAGGSTTLQGVFGGVSVGGAGLAIAVVPLLEHELGWRAPYVSALGLALAVVPLLLAAPAARHRADVGAIVAAGVVRDRGLYRFAVIHTATFGLSVVLGNWIVTLLTDEGFARDTAGAVGAFVLLGGLVTRPVGGWAIRARPAWTRVVVVGGVAAASAGAFLLASGVEPLLVLGSVLLGIAAGLPFAAAFTGAQRLR